MEEAADLPEADSTEVRTAVQEADATPFHILIFLVQRDTVTGKATVSMIMST